MKPASLLKLLPGLLAALTLLLTPAWGQNSADPAPPPSAPPKRSAADLEKLVAPIALYPDAVIATLLPASVYPLEIVQAARFVADTNNLAKLDAQPWDINVKEVARIPAVITKMNDDLAWTQELGEAFLADDKGVMDAIQAMRGKAQKAGTLQTTPQQIVVVTNMITEKTVEQQVVVVTNTIVQIQPANPQIVYVPTYNPYTVYYPPPAYVVNPYPLLTFGAGIAVGAIIANNCDWHYGGCYHGGYYGGGSININGDVNINRGNNINTGNINTGNIGSGNRQKWQPDQNRLNKSGSPNAASSFQSREARGYGSTANTTRTANTARTTTGAMPGANAGANRPATSAANAGNRPAAPATYPGDNARPAAGNATAGNVSRPAPSQANTARATPAARPSSGSGSSAFGNMNSGANTRQQSSRGAASRGGGGGGARAGGGGGRR